MEKNDLAVEDSYDLSKWQKVTAFLKKVSVVTGDGLVYLYKTGDNHKHFSLPIVNGVMGDTLADMHSPLAISMSFREHGRDVTVENLHLRNRLVDEGQHVVIFVHGLMGDEMLWQATGGETCPRYGTLLETELGITPLYLRYNSGLHISENGQRLNQLLQEVMATYGNDIKKITLVGYSMGGLVVRSAGYYAEKFQCDWLTKLISVILISVPQDGSYLEQLSHLTAFILRTIPNIPTRLVAKAIDKRSHGIKDLRYGFIIEEDWQKQDNHQLFGVQRTPIHPLPGIAYHIIAATLVDDDTSPLAVFFGDGLVGHPSAAGQIFRDQQTHLRTFITCKTFPKNNHATILTNIDVYEYLKYLVDQFSGG